MEALASVLLEHLALATKEMSLGSSIKEDVRKLEETLQTLKAVLEDAERRQLKESAVKLWLDQLKDVVYEADDLLDEWICAVIKSKLDLEVRFFFFFPSSLKSIPSDPFDSVLEKLRRN